jgi:hypothetical protein
LLGAYGLIVEKRLIADSHNNPFPVSVNGGESQHFDLLQYPFWPSIGPEGVTSSGPFIFFFQGLDLFWASPIRIESGVSAEVLISTSADSIASWHILDLTPTGAQNDYSTSKEPRQSLPVAVLRTGELDSAFVADDPPLTKTQNARLVVIGDAQFASDLLQVCQSYRNIDFLRSVVIFLANKEKGRRPRDSDSWKEIASTKRPPITHNRIIRSTEKRSRPY